MKYLLLLMKAALVALILTLPLALWDPNAFWHSAITLQFAQPFRHDALSYLAWAWYAWDRDIPPQLGWLGLALAIPATALCLWRLRRGPAAFALSIALVYFVLFLFSKQAFCNYYLFVIAALCWASALLATHTPEPVSFAPQPAPDPPRPASRSFAV